MLRVPSPSLRLAAGAARHISRSSPKEKTMKRPAVPRPAASPADGAAGPGDLGALPEWDLGDLYPGMASRELASDLAAAKDEATALAERYKGKLATLDGAGLATAVRAYEALD